MTMTMPTGPHSDALAIPDAPSTPPRRMEARESAVTRLGSHWNAGHDEQGLVAVETLGPDKGWSVAGDPDMPSDLHSVLAHIRARRAQEAKFTRSRVEQRLSGFVNRSRVWLASFGMHSQTAAILADRQRLRAMAAESAKALEECGTPQWQPRRIPLPDMLHLPMPLEIGSTIWEVGYEWPFEHGIRLSECTIDSAEVYAWGKNGYDATVTYRLRRVRTMPEDAVLPAGEPQFSFDRDDLSDPAIPSTDSRNSRLFLTRRAAIDHLAEVAGRLSLRAGEAVLLVEGMAGSEETFGKPAT